MSPGPETCHCVTSPGMDTRTDDANNHELYIIFTPEFMMVIVVKSMITSILCSLGIIYLGGLFVCIEIILFRVQSLVMQGWPWLAGLCSSPLHPYHVSCVMAHGSYHAGDQGEDHTASQAGQLGAKHPDQKYTHTIAIVCLHVVFNSVQQSA